METTVWELCSDEPLLIQSGRLHVTYRFQAVSISVYLEGQDVQLQILRGTPSCEELTCQLGSQILLQY